MQAYLLALTLDGVQDRLGPPHKTDIQGKVSKWWGYRCGPWRWSVYERIGHDEFHIGGTTADAAWFALTVLRVPQSIAWRPSGVPSEWWSALVNAEVPRKAHNAANEARP